MVNLCSEHMINLTVMLITKQLVEIDELLGKNQIEFIHISDRS